MKIQKWFIPSRRNNYHPHALRPIGLGMLVAALLLVNCTYNLTAAHKFQVLGYATNISASEIINLTNQQRSANGLGGLATNGDLMQAAAAKAQDMFAKNYWAHYSPTGTSPWYWITSSGYAYSTAGENLAKDFDSSAGVMTGWMNSPDHRANILNSSFKDIGVAAVNGTLQGSQTTLVVAMYASPKPAPAPAPTPAPTKPKVTSAPKTTPAVPSSSQPAPAETPPTTTPTTTTEQTDTTPDPTVTTSQSPPKSTPTTAAGSTDKNSDVRTVALQNVSARESRTWAQNASFFLLSVFFLINVLKHTIVWRTQKRGWRHIWLRAHPLAQYALILVALGANVVSSSGLIK